MALSPKLVQRHTAALAVDVREAEAYCSACCRIHLCQAGLASRAQALLDEALRHGQLNPLKPFKLHTVAWPGCQCG